jgi:hypothetical protein
MIDGFLFGLGAGTGFILVIGVVAFLLWEGIA